MLKGINSMKLNNKSSNVVQVNNVVGVTSNTGRYANIGVASHAQYNNDVSQTKAQYIFDTKKNIAFFTPTDETIDFTRFVTIGEEAIICGCITMHDIIDFYANNCIQQFYEDFCSSHSDKECETLARFLSAIGVEVWRNVTCYGGIYKDLYMVSNLGRVLRLYKTKDFTKILKPCDKGKGYLHLTLCCNGKKQNVRVNRLVALTYYGESTEPLEACHANGIPTDNRLFNLDLKTHIENMQNPLTQRKNKDKFNKKAESTTPTATESE